METRSKYRIESVKIEHAIDTDPDTSYLGEYGNKATSPAAIDRVARGDAGRGEYRWFNPALTGEQTGNPESPEQDYQRMEALNNQQWYFIGIIAKARIVSPAGVIQTIRSGGLWGIESDSDKSYIESVENEQLAELRAELESLEQGIGKRAIDHAFANVERD